MEYPDTVVAIKTQLIALQKGGSPLTVVTAHGIILAMILHMKPEILNKKFKDGSTFQASDLFVQGWLHKTLSWSVCKATWAAQKLPDDWEDQCERSFFHKAYIIKEEDIPPSLYVNSDQTQVVYVPGNWMMWADTSAKQVSVISVDEKWAFTVLIVEATYSDSGMHSGSHLECLS